jgi:glycosyltransferase involved in cell wall biosynthesis
VSVPTVTVAIPTFCRAALLQQSLRSVLAQDYPAFDVVVLDNASTDHTESVVRACADPRVSYVRHSRNIGLFLNWKRALETSSRTGAYIVVLQDDNLLLPGFLRRSVDALERHSGAGFSFTFADAIDIDGNPTGRLEVDGLPDGGLLPGLDYLHRIVAGENVILRDSTVMLRASAVAAVGGFDNPHADNSIDLNLFLRLAEKHDVAFVPERLAQVRQHVGQDSEKAFRGGGLGVLAKLAERMGAVAYLMRSARAADGGYRVWLAERLLHLGMLRSEMMMHYAPELKPGESERLNEVRRELQCLFPVGSRFILADADAWGADVAPGRTVIPFLERNGQYWGPPPDDETAIRELERLRDAGASALVFGWPAFWWIDYYAAFREYLYSTYQCTRGNSRLLVFDLQVPVRRA